MKSNLWPILKKELREVFRDKKSLAMMLIIPFMIPLLVIGMSALFDSQIKESLESSSNIGFNYPLSDVELELAKQNNIKTKVTSDAKLQQLLEEEKIDLYITKDDKNYTIHYDQNSETSSASTSVAESYLQQYKSMLQNQYLQEAQIDSNQVLNIITINYEENGKEGKSFYANYVTSYAFLFVIMAITISATYPATDATAGEKERGTLETLLTFPIKSKDIIVGKFLSVSLSSVITGLLSFILAIVSLLYVGNTFDIYKNISILPDMLTVVMTIIIIICYSLLISGLCIAIASLSKSFKEAQSALTPLTFISFFPGMIAFMINVKTTALISIIPFLNYTQIFNDVNDGNINYLHIMLMFISTIIYIFLVIQYIIKQYRSEKVLFHQTTKA